MQTIITPLVHSENEHAIVALFSEDSEKQIVFMQNKLLELFGDAIWLQQPPALHMTLMEIICDIEYKGLSREQYFMQWYEAHNQTVKDILADLPPFDVRFSELIVSPRAIIVKAADAGPFNAVREKLLSRTKLPEGTKLPPDITHSTLARFNKVIDLEDAIQHASEIPVNFTEHIKEFSLMKDLGPPDFNGVPMQTYPLSGA